MLSQSSEARLSPVELFAEEVPSRDNPKELVWASDSSARPTTNDQRVVIFSLPGGVDIFRNTRLVAVQLPELLGQYEWIQVDSMTAKALVTQITYETTEVNYTMVPLACLFYQKYLIYLLSF